MKRKGKPGSRSVENISDKRLRIEVLPARTNQMERVKSFVNIHLHCIVIHQQPEKYKQNFDISPYGKISVDAHGCTDFDLILGS